MRWKIVAIVSILLISLTMAQAATEKVLYTFTGGIDGGQPNAGVTFGYDGNLYGVTTAGGTYGQGTVFQLVYANGSWTYNVLYNFTGGVDGGKPVGGVAFDDGNNLYGTTTKGGDPSAQCGTVFAIKSWIFQVIHTFTDNPDGCVPLGDLEQNGGLLWGTTVAGGASYQGTVFTMDTVGGNEIVHPLKGNVGSGPSGGMIWDYGVTYWGGKYRQGTLYGFNNQAPWGILKAYHTFNSTQKIGYNPIGNVAENGAGQAFGVTGNGSMGGHGAVYEMYHLYPWSLGLTSKLLHSFSGADGAMPQAGPILDAAGNLYGTTSGGGPGGQGTVYKLTPGAKGKWNLTTLYSFTGGADGGLVWSGVVQDFSGNLYGTTYRGGAYGQGVVYEIIP